MSGMLKRLLSVLTIVLTMTSFLGVAPVFAQATLYTPYTGLSATPGETIDYTIDVINNESTIQNVTFDLEGLPEGWKHTITANGNAIEQLSVRGNSEEQITLEVTVPLEIEQADYEFNLVATDQNGRSTELPFLVKLAEEGTFETELNVDQPNLQGQTDSSFSYSATLKNRTAEEQNYALTANAPEGWGVQFKNGSDNVTSVTVEPNSEKDITIDVTPPENASADTYEIGISAAGSGTSVETTLEAVITGSYDLKLTTPKGILSADITSGGDRVIDLVVENTGTAPLTNVELSASTPPNWESEFDTSTIPEIAPGESATVKATLTASDEAIAGDYVTTFKASAAETSAEADFRVSVHTSTLWGIIGVLIILGVVAGLYYMIKKYGRR
ncbi:NEW3 domain-containing protein [Oceanobacillus senegalensis]|uniref:COG1470 family protein n=1 Tax=Oceanobacillus senegalensis TaxID=1936063 RepID=UPI000A3127EC|nr:NEW3 domain-containing protein [Oceanobacillus senegalensis]